jgi:hypothetical protein
MAGGIKIILSIYNNHLELWNAKTLLSQKEKNPNPANKRPSTFPVTLHTSLALTLNQTFMPAIPSLWLNWTSTTYPFPLVTFDVQVLFLFQRTSV